MGNNSSIPTEVIAYLPGISALLILAIVSWTISTYIIQISELIIAILLGAVIANTIGVSDRLIDGIQTHKIWLATGIVLMGASLSINQLLENGFIILLSVLVVVSLTVLLIELLSRLFFNINKPLGSLLAAGASICGVSAVAAVAASIDAKEEYIAYAAATILFFDALTIFIYPIIGNLLELPPQVFGIWAGTTMFSTGPVVAAGFAHSDAAGQWATITKLTRNALIGFVAIAYAVYYTQKKTHSNSVSKSIFTIQRLIKVWKKFPKFVLGFFFLMIIASAGLLSDQDIRSIEATYSWLFLLAFVGLGTEIELSEFRSAGYRPIVVVSTAFILMSTISLFALLIILQ